MVKAETKFSRFFANFLLCIIILLTSSCSQTNKLSVATSRTSSQQPKVRSYLPPQQSFSFRTQCIEDFCVVEGTLLVLFLSQIAIQTTPEMMNLAIAMCAENTNYVDAAGCMIVSTESTAGPIVNALGKLALRVGRFLRLNKAIDYVIVKTGDFRTTLRKYPGARYYEVAALREIGASFAARGGETVATKQGRVAHRLFASVKRLEGFICEKSLANGLRPDCWRKKEVIELKPLNKDLLSVLEKARKQAAKYIPQLESMHNGVKFNAKAATYYTSDMDSIFYDTFGPSWRDIIMSKSDTEVADAVFRKQGTDKLNKIFTIH